MDDEDGDFYRGLLIGLVLGVLLWILLGIPFLAGLL